jgi:hypothetical protein
MLEAMPNFKLAAITSLLYSVYFTLLNWPLVRAADDPRGSGLFGFFVTLLFAIISIALLKRQKWALYFTIIFSSLLSVALLIIAPMMFGQKLLLTSFSSIRLFIEAWGSLFFLVAFVVSLKYKTSF